MPQQNRIKIGLNSHSLSWHKCVSRVRCVYAEYSGFVSCDVNTTAIHFLNHEKHKQLLECSSNLIQSYTEPVFFSSQEKRKRQTEIENKKRQLEDDRRQLQHLKVRLLALNMT